MLFEAMVHAFLALLILGATAGSQPPAWSTAGPAVHPTEVPEHAAATIGIRPDGCQALWNSEPTTIDEILDRSVNILVQAIDRIGGPQYATEENFPYLSLDAPSGTTWQCMGPSLFAVQRSGMIKLGLHDAFLFFALNVHGAAEPRAATVDIGADGRIAWNGDRVDLNGLRAQVRALGDEASVPDRLFLNVAPEATFLDLYSAARAIDEAGGRATLTGCGGPVGPYRPGAPLCRTDRQSDE